MSNPKVYIEFTKAREGGLSKAKTDSASRFPCPVDPDGKPGTGYHTNKGITWRAFCDILPRHGMAATPEAFYKMSDLVFDIIFTHYWNRSGASLIHSQAIANLVFQSLWGGGHQVLVRDMQLYLRSRGVNISANGFMGDSTASAINNYCKTFEKMFHDVVFEARMNYLKSLKAFAANGKGWTARMEKLYKFNLTLIP